MYLALLHAMLRNYDPADVDTTMSPAETMDGSNYIEIGASAVEVIMMSVMASRLTQVRTVLDLPCGHGRVLRHLVKMFPEAAFDACDLDVAGVEFCVKQFGARAISGHPDLTQTELNHPYDLIWIGSLFTHLSEDLTLKGLAFLSRQLSPTGIIVSTFHGRWATRMQRMIPYTDERRWSRVLEGYYVNGFGYVDYDTPAHDFVGESYGVSAAKPHKLIEIIERIPGVRIFLYREKGWGNNHDVIAFGRPDWDE